MSRLTRSRRPPGPRRDAVVPHTHSAMMKGNLCIYHIHNKSSSTRWCIWETWSWNWGRTTQSTGRPNSPDLCTWTVTLRRVQIRPNVKPAAASGRSEREHLQHSNQDTVWAEVCLSYHCYNVIQHIVFHSLQVFPTRPGVITPRPTATSPQTLLKRRAASL